MKKRFISLVLILGLVITSTAVADKGTSIVTANTTAVVNNPVPDDRLNLRTKPSEDAPTLGKYYNGTYVEVLSDEKDGWVKVRLFNLAGYMMAKFLVSPEQLEVGALTVPAVKIKNAGGTGLNLRKTQSMDSASLGLYKNGSTVRVFGVSETWCHVQTEDGKVGFMLREQLSPVLAYQKNSNSNGSASQSNKNGATVNNPNLTDRLNLRTRPGEDAPTLGKYYTGTYVEVLSAEKNGWVKVRFAGLEGYMLAKFLAFGNERGQVGSAIPVVKIKNAGGTGLNLRKSQSTSSPSLGLYPNGQTVSVYGVSEAWCHVETGDGKIGFMLREQLSPVLEFDKGSGSSGGTGGASLEGTTNYDENGVAIGGNG